MAGIHILGNAIIEPGQKPEMAQAHKEVVQAANFHELDRDSNGQFVDKDAFMKKLAQIGVLTADPDYKLNG